MHLNYMGINTNLFASKYICSLREQVKIHYLTVNVERLDRSGEEENAPTLFPFKSATDHVKNPCLFISPYIHISVITPQDISSIGPNCFLTLG